MPLDDELEQELEALTRQDRLRDCPPLSGPSRVSVTREDRPGALVSFCSNDYLGLASHPALREATATSLATEGMGAGAARLVSGDLPAHRRLEATLARTLSRPAALLFPTGYQANLGTLSALAGRDDLIASDALNHASLIDGCRLSRATIVRYAHANPSDAARALATPGTFRRRFLVSESLFSMDGDVAPVGDLAEVATRAGATFVVDEAHALGVLGPGGKGVCAAAGVSPPVLIGTLGKAFGAAGGFATGSAVLRRYLLNRARTFIFTTGSPPPVAAAATAALDLAAGPEGDLRRSRLRERIDQLRERLGRPLASLPSPILPLILGPDGAAVRATSALLARGFFVQAIRPPTVPEGTARLRITLSADHTPAQVDALADALASLLPSPEMSPP